MELPQGACCFPRCRRRIAASATAAVRGRAELRGNRQSPAGEFHEGPAARASRLVRRVQQRQVMNARRWSALAVMLLAVFLAAVDFNVVTIAIPSIQRGLGANFSEIQLIVAGHAPSFAVPRVPR